MKNIPQPPKPPKLEFASTRYAALLNAMQPKPPRPAAEVLVRKMAAVTRKATHP